MPHLALLVGAQQITRELCILPPHGIIRIYSQHFRPVSQSGVHLFFFGLENKSNDEMTGARQKAKIDPLFPHNLRLRPMAQHKTFGSHFRFHFHFIQK